MKWTGDAVLRELHSKIGLELEAAVTVTVWPKSQETCPYRTGRLHASGVVSREGETVAASYDTKYAVYVHENPNLNIQNGKRGKWLELSSHEESASLVNKLAENLKW